MRIIHVVLGKANPLRMNGVNRVVNELATRQYLAGETVSVWGITRELRHDYPERPYLTVLFRSRPAFMGLGKEFIRTLEGCPRDCVFHLHGGFIPLYFWVAKALRQRGFSYVLTAHGSYNTIALQKGRIRKKWYFRLFEIQVLRYAHRIHCLGQSEVEGVNRLYANSKTVLIPYGYESDEKVSLLNDSKTFVIGYCGRLDIYTKGLDLLLTAFSHLANIVPGIQLWIIGDGKGRMELEKHTIQLGLSDKVIFWGSKFGQEKIDLLRQLSIFAHPSRNEGLPTAVLEAASLGIPCVITEATNTGDAVRNYDCGVVIERPGSCELFGALMTMHKRIRKTGRAYFAENSRRMVGQVYDWSVILQRFHQLYGWS